MRLWERARPPRTGEIETLIGGGGGGEAEPPQPGKTQIRERTRRLSRDGRTALRRPARNFMETFPRYPAKRIVGRKPS